MKIKNLFKSAIAIGSLVVLSGCANTQGGASHLNAYYSTSNVSQEHRLHNNVQVGDLNGFLDTSKNLFSTQKTANLSEDEARKALEESLRQAGMLSNSGKYRLDAELVDADLAGLMSHRMTERNITISYVLSEAYRATLYESVITGRGENQIGFINNQWKEERVTAERAYQDNFRQLIEDLKNI